MGNDHSQMSGMQVEEKAVEVTDFWSHHKATVNSGTAVSVFAGESVVGGSLWVSQTPLEKASKNLMIHRHPSILRYISSWSKGSKYYLAVEDVRPLSHVLPSQSMLQVCVGLHGVLKALVFLHEKASASHNNVCSTSVYVTKDGSWKLGGLEYLCKFNDMTGEYMARSRSHRYNKAVDPNEDKNVSQRQDSVDIYAFATLVAEVYKKDSADTIPSLSNFVELCKNELQSVDVSTRPTLSSLLKHPFFNHEFISIYSFLTELPLKSDTEKNDFFLVLIGKLRSFDEEVVASQMSALLLSRMVLLNKCAQTDVVPHLLKPKNGAVEEGGSLFTINVFKKHLVPKLLEIFCVRDAQIRLLLLQYFQDFVNCFTREQLQLQILPELLVGIKDTNDLLVEVTLKSLASLIPILGSSTVIGGKRAKLFNDGRPISHTSKPRSRRNSRRSQDVPQPVLSVAAAVASVTENDILSNSSSTEVNLELPERPSPDGEEDDASTDEVEPTPDEEIELGTEEEEAWGDWDINEDEAVRPQVEEEPLEMPNVIINVSLPQYKKEMPDILELDIKNQKNANQDKMDDFDFFQDMEPVIETSSKYVIRDVEKEVSNNNLDVKNVEHHEAGEGWGDDLDWDD